MAEMILYFKTPRGLGTTIHADFLHKTIQIENHTDRILDTAFGVNTTPTLQSSVHHHLGIHE